MERVLEHMVSVFSRLIMAESLKELYDRAADGVKELLRADRSAILLYGDDGRVHFVSWRNLSKGYRVAVDGHSPWSKSDLSARAIFIDDIRRSELSDDIKRAVLAEGIRALCFVPLFSPTELLGKFMVYFNTVHNWTEQEKQVAVLFANTLSAVILRIKNYESLKTALDLNQRNEKLQAILNKILKISIENISLDAKLDKFLNIVIELPDIILENRAALFLINPDKNVLVLKAKKNIPKNQQTVCSEVPVGRCLCGKAAKHKEIQFADCVDYRHENTYEGINPHGHYCVPIKDNDELLGVLTLYTPCGQKPKSADIKVLESIANTIASTILFDRVQSALFNTESTLSSYAAIVHQSTEAIVLTDTSGKIEYVNPAFEVLTGYSASEVIGKNPKILKSDAHKREFFEKLWKTLSSGTPWSGRIVNKNKEGHKYTEEAVIFPIKDQQGRIIKYCKMARDITKEVQLEEQLQRSQKLEALGSLAGGIAHDFNNILTAIKGYAEISLDRIDRQHPLYKPLEIILNAANSAENLVKQLLAFSKQQINQPVIVDINVVIKGLKDMLRKVIEEDISIEYRLTKDPEPVFVDPVQIEQILLNLVVNARDALREKQSKEEKKIMITTEKKFYDAEYQFTHPDITPGKYMSLSVIDNGIGMDNDTLKKIFEPFFTTKGKDKGTGLGLSTVYGIVKQNKGSIYVYSEPNIGTTFKILFPVVSEKEEQTMFKEHSPVRTEELRDAVVLVVEDNEMVRDFIQELLETLGLRVYTAENGLDAMEKIEKEGIIPKVMITDLVMPMIDGKELAEKIKKIVPDVKIIFTSGYTEEKIDSEIIDNKNVFFLQKPISSNMLIEVLKKALSS